jgi:DHA1 family bicyclomycin/chloramphenicol resistance-like MFS transporter
MFKLSSVCWFRFGFGDGNQRHYPLKTKKFFTRKGFIREFKELIKFKRTIGFTIISGFITGSFMVYLSSSQQIFQSQYNLEEEFPFIFAGLAISIGAAVF